MQDLLKAPLDSGQLEHQRAQSPLQVARCNPLSSETKFHSLALTKLESVKHTVQKYQCHSSWMEINDELHSSPQREDLDIMGSLLTRHPSETVYVEATIIQKQLTFAISCIYGHNTQVPRRALWNSLRSISSSLSSTPWLVFVDLNVVRSPSERLGGDPCRPSHLEDLNECRRIHY